MVLLHLQLLTENHQDGTSEERSNHCRCGKPFPKNAEKNSNHQRRRKGGVKPTVGFVDRTERVEEWDQNHRKNFDSDGGETGDL